MASGVEEKQLVEAVELFGESASELRFGMDAVDLASTGGAGSLSTILGPLYLRALGAPVAAIGVPGRPAGAIDVLWQIPGYRVHVTPPEAKAILGRSGYVHVDAGLVAPLDARLFALRRAGRAPDHPDLAIVSLLAKKLAAGVRRVGLDIRLHPGGAFGSDATTAGASAARFIRVARSLGIAAHCFLSDGYVLPQPFLGRSESLLALDDVLAGSGTSHLRHHSHHVAAMAMKIVGSIRWPRLRDVLDAFESNLSGQGSSRSAFDEVVDEVRRSPRMHVKSRAAGYPSLDLVAARGILIRAQANWAGTSLYPDPLGLIWETDRRWLPAGAVVMSIRDRTGTFIADLERATTVAQAPSRTIMSPVVFNA